MPESNDRRKFLNRIIGSVGGIVGVFLALPLVSSMLDPLLRKTRKEWRKVGSPGDFAVGSTTLVTFEDAAPYEWSKSISKTAAYLRRVKENEFIAFSVNCAHLGCPVRWVESSELFLCPCHGGVYYKDGSRASGPPVKGLSQYPVRISGDKIEIKTEAIPITTLSAGEKVS